MNILRLEDLPKPFIIADVGSNWKVGVSEDDQLIAAKRHILDAAACGVSAVKFQLFTDLELYGFPGPDRFALPRSWIPELASYAASCGIEFMCSAFSVNGIQCVDNWVNIHKLASAEMKHPFLIDTLAKIGKPTLISTGGAHYLELGLVSDRWQENAKAGQMVFLECVARYPATAQDYNLRTIQKNRVAGISDHTIGSQLTLTAVGAGAWIFEKHFNALFDLANEPVLPDHSVSIGPADLKRYCAGIREAFASMGDGEKRTRPTEKEMLLRWRRRIKATMPIRAGEKLVYGLNFGIFRSIADDPHGDAPENWERYQESTAKKDFEVGDGIFINDIEKIDAAG